ncbi:serine hydrolase [Sphingomonas sp. BK235]|uniref:serine hydrolase n=1 Tax=Sphingomonas sp. BK235 TaxID=2512131 RepID=UPI001046BCF2|nr:serine hydrolase [Sphingomonas sp. BK235]TCP35839.1 beta-lactamase class A [Sphingomonas sp. BK235]
MSPHRLIAPLLAAFALAAPATPAAARDRGAVRPQPPARLLNAVEALGQRFPGAVGISVRDVERGWTVSWQSGTRRPQQSVSKLWVALATFDAIDRGTLSLRKTVTVRRADLTLFHQPIRARVGAGGLRITIAGLLDCALTRSDNTCNDVLLRQVGGPAAVRRTLTRKGISGVTFGPGERLLQARTAGLTWRDSWAGGDGFLRARARLSLAARRRALDRYVASPPDGASADGVTLGLARLAQGRLLSKASTARMLALMRASRTGPLRLRSGLGRGWTLAHKTGTGQELAGTATGTNDVGLLTAPDGHRYAVAVLIARTRAPLRVRLRLMGDVTRAVVRAHG